MRSSDHGWLSLPDATRIRARAQATVAAFDNNATNGNDGGKRRRLRLSDKDLRDELEAWFERRSRRGDGDGGEQRRDDAVDPTTSGRRRRSDRAPVQAVPLAGGDGPAQNGLAELPPADGASDPESRPVSESDPGDGGLLPAPLPIVLRR